MEKKIIRLKEVDSTNAFLKNLGTYDEDALTIAVADYQTAGRGQGVHTWESEPGKNLLFSMMMCPKWVPLRQQFLLSEAGALAVKDALDSYTDGITLKWPNDVYWYDKKISGTLIETAIDSKGIKRCIFGIGINVNQTEFHSDAPNPVSLAQILGHEVDREEVQVQGRAEVGFWAAMVGGVAMLVGRGIPGVWECGVTMGLAVGAGWCAGLINAVELMSELGLGALTVAGMYPRRSSCVY